MYTIDRGFKIITMYTYVCMVVSEITNVNKLITSSNARADNNQSRDEQELVLTRFIKVNLQHSIIIIFCAGGSKGTTVL